MFLLRVTPEKHVLMVLSLLFSRLFLAVDSELLEELEWGDTGSFLCLWCLEASVAHLKNPIHIYHMGKLMPREALRSFVGANFIKHKHIPTCIKHTHILAI